MTDVGCQSCTEQAGVFIGQDIGQAGSMEGGVPPQYDHFKPTPMLHDAARSHVADGYISIGLKLSRSCVRDIGTTCCDCPDGMTPHQAQVWKRCG